MNWSPRVIVTPLLAVTLVFGSLLGVRTLSTSTQALPTTQVYTMATSSTTLQPLIEQAIKGYLSRGYKLEVNVQGGIGGISSVLVGQSEVTTERPSIWVADKPVNRKEFPLNHVVAGVGVAVVVNPSVTVTNLSKQQLSDIFTHKITNWKHVGGPNLHIVIINRAKATDIRDTLQQQALDGAEIADSFALTQQSAESMRKMVAQVKGAIGYLALPDIDKSVRKVNLNGIEPSVASVMNGTYPVWSYASIYTIEHPSAVTRSFINYLRSPEIQNTLLTKLGYVPFAAMKSAQ